MLEPKGKILGEKADIWMLGCVAYILAFGGHPFEQGKPAILKGDVSYPKEGFMTDLIREMLRSEPSTRPTAE
jgi:AP2-associated kinase